jgi:TrwC relaxase
MTIAKITAGDGYTYLTRHTAHGDSDLASGHDATAYYTATGNPAGRWIGRGAPLLGLQNRQVTEEQMRALFGYGQHPDAEPMIAAYIEASTRPDMTAKQLAAVRNEAIKAATLGRRFPEYEALEKFDQRVAQRLQVIADETGREPTSTEIKKIKMDEARRQRAAVAGFDLVFSPVKSAALLWALDERPWVRKAIRDAHEQAMHEALDLVEEHAAYTRAGTGGIAQIATHGLICAAFDHYDSRAGDPNLHTHVAVSSKVQGSDGTWRALDARALYRITVTASELSPGEHRRLAAGVTALAVSPACSVSVEAPAMLDEPPPGRRTGLHRPRRCPVHQPGGAGRREPAADRLPHPGRGRAFGGGGHRDARRVRGHHRHHP